MFERKIYLENGANGNFRRELEENRITYEHGVDNNGYWIKIKKQEKQKITPKLDDP